MAGSRLTASLSTSSQLTAPQACSSSCLLTCQQSNRCCLHWTSSCHQRPNKHAKVQSRASRLDCLAELAGARWDPPRHRGIPKNDLDRAGIRGKLWWGLLKIHIGGNDVELACQRKCQQNCAQLACQQLGLLKLQCKPQASHLTDDLLQIDTIMPCK